MALKIISVVNTKKNRSAAISRTLEKLLRGHCVRFVDLRQLDNEKFSQRYDFGISIGGDGTFVSMVRNLHDVCNMFFGINDGVVGFLTEVTFENLEFLVNRFLRGEFFKSPRNLLKVEVIDREGSISEYVAVNDAYFLRTQDKGMVNLAFGINGEGYSEIRGDGLILSTATGSTAYSLAAGGPILYPTLKGFVLTPICSHSLGQKPIVMPFDTLVEVRPLGAKPKVALFIDGHLRIPISTQTLVRVSMSKLEYQVISFDKSFFFANLADKLHWR